MTTAITVGIAIFILAEVISFLDPVYLFNAIAISGCKFTSELVVFDLKLRGNEVYFVFIAPSLKPAFH